MPFSGGRRVCFGKTFAEANLKYMATYLSQFLDFEFCTREKELFKDEYPVCIAFKPCTEAIIVKIR